KQRSSSPANQTVKQKPYYGPLEQLVETFIRNNPDVRVKTDTASDMPREEGFVFQSSKNGLITSLGVNLPYVGGTYTVSLWDYDTRQLLKQYPVTVTTMGFGFAYVDMEAISETVPIVANKKYIVSVFIKTNGLARWPFYYLLKSDSNNTAVPFLPFTQGSLTLLNGQTLLTSSPAFPANQVYHMDILNGLCDIGFKATEK
ncbi:MAG TPA: DUF4082 domain-containing protein, partial [Chitinophagaceae bacterium]